ncbi:MAG: TIGR01212 family radical SAM protein [Deltaproteobacteria bacterium]|nr:TIGR01212 family radical SAM protein [Deltaproteobacteria bacterium]
MFFKKNKIEIANPLKRYYDYNTYLRDLFGERVQKIPLDAGFSCPNRDGTISDKGCIYCDSRGSGTGAMMNKGMSINDQIIAGKRFAEVRYKAKKFIAYFQSFTNTYASVSKLQACYAQALDHPGIIGLAIGTRPDCINKDILELLRSYQKDYLVWLEYGLQSCHDRTLALINRGHDYRCFEKSVYMADDYGLNVCAHVILGLPGENREMMLETARKIATLPIKGVKIHLLYVVKNTGMEDRYQRGDYQCLGRNEYVELVVDFLELLPPKMVIQRLTGDPVLSELVAPLWAADKINNLRQIQNRLEERDTFQGRLFKGND